MTTSSRSALDPTLAAELGEDTEWALRSGGALGLDAHASESLSAKAAQVRDRLSDPALYIAVVGEFNAGKSTFLNTLLRDRLLPTAPVVTTGAATEIRHAIAPSLTFTPHGGSLVAYEFAASSPFQRELRRIGGAATGPADVRSAIRVLIADPAVCTKVRTVTIGHPAPLLEHDVVLVDTPGINATDDLHAEVVEQVVARTADLALVLIPANSPTSQVLTTFLSSTLSRHLDRCVFVVTKLDDVEPEHRATVLRSVRTRLQKVGVTAPRIYDGGGSAVLDRLTSGAEGDDGTAAFLRLERDLAGLAAAEHATAVATSASHLVADLLEAASRSAAEHRDDIAQAERALGELAVRDLGQFVAEHTSRAREELRTARDEQARSVDRAADRRRRSLEKDLQKGLDACIGTDGVEAFVKVTAPELVAEELRKWSNRANKDLRGVTDAADRAITRAASDFSDQYRRLAELAGRAPAAMNVPAASGTPASAEVEADFSAAIAGARSAVTSENWTIGGLGAAGAVVGTILFPGVGTLLGGMLGAALGGVGADKRLRKAREQVRGPLLDGARSAVEDAADTLRGAVDAVHEAERKRCDRALSALRRAAAGPVRDLLEQEKRQRAEIAEARTLAAFIQQEADERLTRLAARRATLTGGVNR